ncbi:hypothetical protein [Marinicauda algicola]|uniref:hypothetical protein n=1 Tax=Marinicauda algicola TaxID=2029849 RepID=UPI001863E16A|nr:hypothetical protein [Marinicauda algicola]
MTGKSLGMALVTLAGVAISVVFLVFAGKLLPAVEMGVHGWAALVLGTALSFLVGGGLSAILVIGRRRGYDEAAHDLYRARFETDPDTDRDHPRG